MGLLKQQNSNLHLTHMNQLDWSRDTVKRTIQNLIVKDFDVFGQITVTSFVSGINFEVWKTKYAKKFCGFNMVEKLKLSGKVYRRNIRSFYCNS